MKKKLTPSQRRRADLYDEGVRRYMKGDASALVRCIHHPDRAANRSGFVTQRKRLCDLVRLTGAVTALADRHT
jgi:hypothetical protein